MATRVLDQHEVQTGAAHGEKTGLWSWITTVDHKRIGSLYGATAFFFFLLGGLEALLLRIQLGSPENTFLSPDTYNQMFTMHGTTMIFLAIMPLGAMFFNYMLPLQIGARDVAFPRLNAFSYWVFLLGGLYLNAGFLFGAAPDTGWYGYANLTSRQFSPGPNVDYWNMGLQILGVASLAAAVNFFVTIVNLRARGVTMMRLPVFSRKPLFGYAAMVFSGVFIAFLGFGVWSHHMFTTGMGPLADTFFALSTMLIAVPTGVKIFNWIGTMWGGSIGLKTPMLFAIGFIALFIVGGLSGVSHAVAPHDAQQQDTYYIVAHIHYVLFGGALFGLFAGIYYWFPKMTGKLLNEGLGKWHFWLFFIGMNITFFPMHYVGLNGMPRRIYTYAEEFGWEGLNLLSTIGYFIIFIGVLVFIVNFLRSVRSGQESGHDPWDAPGVEWSISSPPPAYNFARIPRIVGRDHYWIVKRRAEAEGHPITGPEPHVDPRTIHMPSPSYWPIVVSFGLAWLAAGFLIPFPLDYIKYPISFIGGIITILGIIGWSNEPPAAETHEHRHGAEAHH